MASEARDWLALHRRLRPGYIMYVEDARAEQRYLEEVRRLDAVYHRQARQARCLSGWLRFLRDEDITHVERNDWADDSELRDALPAAHHRYAHLVRLLRRRPEAVALLARQATPRLGPKASAVLGPAAAAAAGLGREQQALAETLAYALYANVFERAEFPRLRAAVGAVLREAGADALLPRDAADGGDDDDEEAARQRRERHASSVGLLLLRMLLRWHGTRHLVFLLNGIVCRVVGDADLVLDPDARQALEDQKAAEGARQSPAAGPPRPRRHASRRRAIFSPALVGNHLEDVAHAGAVAAAAAAAGAGAGDGDGEDGAPLGGGTAGAAVRATTAATKRLIRHRETQLLRAAESLLDALVAEPVRAWPPAVLQLLADAVRAGRESLPGGEAEYARSRLRLVARVVFDLYLLPALEQSESAGLAAGVQLSKVSRANLEVLAHALRCVLVLGGETTGRHDRLRSLARPLADLYERVGRGLLESMADVLERVPPPRAGDGDADAGADADADADADAPTFSGGTVCLTPAEAVRLHQTLFRNASAWERDERYAELLPFRDLPPLGDMPDELAATPCLVPIGDASDAQPRVRDMNRAVAKAYAAAAKAAPAAVAPEDAAAREAEAAVERPEMRALLPLLARAFFFMDAACTRGYCGDPRDVQALLSHACAYLQPALHDSDAAGWDEASTLAALLREVLVRLGDVDGAERDALLRAVSRRTACFTAAHRRRWAERREALQLAEEDAKAAVHGVRDSTAVMTRTLFGHKAVIFMRSVQIPCRLQLPPTVRSRLAGADAAPAAAAAATGKGPVFSCSSVHTFVREFEEFGESLSASPEVAARVLHCFLSVAQERCTRDRTFSPAEAEWAMQMVEGYVCSRLFRLIFVPAGGPGSGEDEAFLRCVESLQWVEPRHLDLAGAPADPRLWAPAVGCVRRLDDHAEYRTPAAKMRLVTTAVKWVVKVIQAKGGDEGTDADTSLSALIYVLLRARPRSLPSSLFYVATFRPEDKLIGEDGYCLTQFHLAVRFVTDTLAHMEECPGTGKLRSADEARAEREERAAAARAATSRAAFQLVMSNHGVWQRVVACLDDRDLARSRATAQQWTNLERLEPEAVAVSQLTLGAGGHLAGVDNFAFLPTRSRAATHSGAVGRAAEADGVAVEGPAVAGAGAGAATVGAADARRATVAADADTDAAVRAESVVARALAEQSLTAVLADPVHRERFFALCAREGGDEGARFLAAVREYRALAARSPAQLAAALRLYNERVLEAAPGAVRGAAPAVRRRVRERLSRVLGGAEVDAREVAAADQPVGADAVRVFLGDAGLGGGHLTLACAPERPASWVLDKAAGTLAKRGLVPAGADPGSYFLLRHRGPPAAGAGAAAAAGTVDMSLGRWPAAADEVPPPPPLASLFDELERRVADVVRVTQLARYAGEYLHAA